MDGLLLAVDTSTKTASVALYDGISVRAEMTWEAPRRHTVELTPQVVQERSSNPAMFLSLQFVPT